MEDKMCDKSSRRWCARIGLLFTVCTVLFTMVYQIWSYYFSLVSEMDKSSHFAPEIVSMLDVCNGEINPLWNVDTCQINQKDISCTIEPFDTRWFIDAVGNGRAYVSANKSMLFIRPVDACIRVAVWSFPW